MTSIASALSGPSCSFFLAENPKHCYISEIPPREEGRFGRIVTIREAGSGGRESGETIAADAYDQAAWSCPLDAGVKLIEITRSATVAKKPDTPGRAQSKS